MNLNYLFQLDKTPLKNIVTSDNGWCKSPWAWVIGLLGVICIVIGIFL
jgi:hypothetical protein